MLCGDTIQLTTLDESNAEIARGWINDPEVNRYMLAGIIPVTADQERDWYRRAAEDYAAGRAYNFEIRLADSGVYIGNCALIGVDMRHRHAEVGIVIGDLKRQDQGHGGDVIRTLLRFGFDTLGLHRIAIECHATNERGLHLYRKLGFKDCGVLREHVFSDGAWVDEVVLDMLDREWRAADPLGPGRR